jgi:O-antigen/teichoic acid export membrane protein
MAYLRALLNSTLARNAGWSFLGQGLGVVLQAGYFIVIARLLGSTNYGIYTAAFALVAIVSQFSSLGSGYVFLRYVSADRSKFAEYFGNILAITLSVGALLVVALVFIGHIVLDSTHASIVLFIAIGDTICQQLISTLGQVFQTFEKLRVMAQLNVSIGALRFLVALAMFVTMTHANAFQWAIASMAVSILAASLAMISVWGAFGPPSFKKVFTKLGEGIVFSVSGSTTFIYNDVDKVMLGHFGMNAANGIYTMAYRVLNICTTPITSVHNAAFPRFFQLGVGGATKTQPFAKKVLRKTLLLGLAAALLMFLAAPLIPRIVGNGFADSVAALRWLCLIPVFRCFHLSAGDALAAAGYQKYRLVTRIAACALNLGLNFVLIPKYSWLGAAWASLATDSGLGVMDWLTIRWLASAEKSKSAPALEFA